MIPQPDPPTLWHGVSAAVAQRPAPKGQIEADLMIIGGGFSGLSTAYHAASRGQRVVLLEAQRIAWGATGRNAGFVVPNFAKVDPDAVLARLGPSRGAALNDFAADSADLVFDLIRQNAIDCDAAQSGWIQPAHSSAALARTASRARQWANLGRPVEPLTAAEVTGLTGVQGYLGGWIDRSAGVINPVAYARGLAAAAERQGAILHEDATVTALSPEGGDWVAQTAQARIRARRVVVATNAYAGGLVPGLARSFYPLRVFQIATRPLPSAIRARLLPGNSCVSDTRRNLFTFRFDAMNRLISGGMHIVGPGAASRVPNAIHRRMAAMLDLPDLPPLDYGWSGMAAVMPDFLPHFATPAPGLIAGFACNGRGIAMTTAMGQVLADWATGTPVEGLPLLAAPPQPIPFHAVMRHAPNALLPVSMLRDWRDIQR